MRQILAITSVNLQHKQLIFDDLKNISRKTRLPLDTILQEELVSLESALLENRFPFKSFPNITLTIPNYQEHRHYLQNYYKSAVIFKKFILLISQGDSYQQLVKRKNEQILKEYCRSWNTRVECVFDSYPVFIRLEQQIEKVNKVLMEMDIRGKITKINATTKFHLIQSHWSELPNHQISSDSSTKNVVNYSKLFFGIEIECQRRQQQDSYLYVACYGGKDKLIDYKDLSKIRKTIQEKAQVFSAQCCKERRKQHLSQVKSSKKSAKRTIQQKKGMGIFLNKVIDLRKKNQIDLIILSQPNCRVEP